MIPQPGEVWLADRGEETRRLVFVLSDVRFHRAAERAIIAPVLSSSPEPAPPWYIPIVHGSVAVHLVGSAPLTRLLERVAGVDHHGLVQSRRALREIAT